ncbi:MAG: hypothetical protein M3O70_05695 [Actinomycetota bacterium]|nr:hypothetical protein [Actinomycetota bacterium]
MEQRPDAAWESPERSNAPMPSIQTQRVGQIQSPWRWVYRRTDPYGICTPECTVVGSALTTAEITLSGRGSRWYQAIQAFQGGAIKGRLWYNCVGDNSIAPNTSCSDGWQYRENDHFTRASFAAQDVIRHEDADTYWYDFSYGVYPEEFPQYGSRGPDLSSSAFICPRANLNCTFLPTP